MSKFSTFPDLDFSDYVSIADVKAGDIITDHCGVWRAIDVKVWDDGEYLGLPDLLVYCWRTEFVGNLWTDTECLVPAHFRTDWIFQGNRHRLISRAVPVSA